VTRPIFIDIDGTLTDKPAKGGNPICTRIELVRRMISNGEPIVLWSGGGENYVRQFAEEHNLQPHAMLGKPRVVVDDNPKFSPTCRMEEPTWLDEDL